MKIKSIIALRVVYSLSVINSLFFLYYQGLSFLNNGVLNPYAALLQMVIVINSVVIWQACFIILMRCKVYFWLPHFVFFYSNFCVVSFFIVSFSYGQPLGQPC